MLEVLLSIVSISVQASPFASEFGLLWSRSSFPSNEATAADELVTTDQPTSTCGEAKPFDCCRNCHLAMNSVLKLYFAIDVLC